MNSTHLNEHDANQGAQSSGEFLGMTGNSGWYLLGAGGATIMMVIIGSMVGRKYAMLAAPRILASFVQGGHRDDRFKPGRR